MSLEFTFGPRKHGPSNPDPLSPTERRVGAILGDFLAGQHPGTRWTAERAENGSTKRPAEARPTPETEARADRCRQTTG